MFLQSMKSMKISILKFYLKNFVGPLGPGLGAVVASGSTYPVMLSFSSLEAKL